VSYDVFIGIDYSGAELPTSRLKSLQVYAARPGATPEKQSSPTRSNNGKPVNWTRKEIAHHLIGLAQRGERFIAGIDHGFSMPRAYFDRYVLNDWPVFLEDFIQFWPTDEDRVSVESVRDGTHHREGGPAPGMRVGKSNELRLCERWTSSAKSVFLFDVQGSVAKSTHAGIPWLKRIRDEAGDRIHFWPFDGWVPDAGKSVITEVYPSVFRNRYDREGRSADELDAYVVARWLAESAAQGILGRYFEPPLTPSQKEVAAREGWILGVA
jgi:hypothetical protein